VLEALRAQRRPLLRLRQRRGLRRPELDEISSLARTLGLSIDEVPPDELDPPGGSESPSQGLALRVGPLPEASLESLAGGASPRTVVALDGVEDPQNVGAIARVAEGCGVAGLLLTRRRSAPLGAAVSRASSGAIEWLPVARVANLRRSLLNLKERGFWVYGCDPSGGDDLFGMAPSLTRGDRVVVLGAEGRGLRPGTRKLVDHAVRIPMAGRVGSLNVATTAAVVLFELARRDHRGDGEDSPGG